MHELFLIKVPETLDTKAFMHPVTIMTRSPCGMVNVCITFSLFNRWFYSFLPYMPSLSIFLNLKIG